MILAYIYTTIIVNTVDGTIVACHDVWQIECHAEPVHGSITGLHYIVKICPWYMS